MCPCVVSFLPLLPLPPLTLSTDVAPAPKWNVLQLIDCSALRSIPITRTSSLLWPLLTSHSSLLLRQMKPPVRSPRLRCALFPLIYPSHLQVLPATFGLHLFWQTYPYFPALYAIPVRRTKGLPTASFRFHLTVDTLAVQLCTSSLPTRTRDFHPLERAHGAQTKERHGRPCLSHIVPYHRLLPCQSNRISVFTLPALSDSVSSNASWISSIFFRFVIMLPVLRRS